MSLGSRAAGRIFSVSQRASNGGELCTHVDGDWVACVPGQDFCPADASCKGTWSDCDANCERQFTQTTAQSGDGDACPPAPVCSPGVEACPFAAIVGEKCSQLRCPNGYRARASASEEKCAAAACTYGAELETCCENVGLFSRITDRSCGCHGCQEVEKEGQ